MMGSMRNWLYKLDQDPEGETKNGGNRVAVVHCKAGKGRSGTVACGYLISEEGWKFEDALQRFTERRMRVGFGAGVSIPSQLRWVGYIDRWAKEMGKNYIERPVEILELHVWGLRDGVKVAVEGFVDEGKKIKCFHLFHRHERTVVDDGKAAPANKNGENNTKNDSKEPSSASSRSTIVTSSGTPENGKDALSSSESTSSVTSRKRPIKAIILRPSKPIILPSSDVNIDFERRSKAAYTGWAMVTSIAHVWFNAYFEGGNNHESGVFETEWDALDGIKGTTKKGIKALERLKVIWRYPPPSSLDMKEPGKEDIGSALGETITVPEPGEPVPESQPADWRGEDLGEDPGRCLRNQENILNRVAGNEDENDSKCLSTASEHPYVSGVSTTAATAASATARGLHKIEKDLGLRKQEDTSKDVSLANSDEDERTARQEKLLKARTDEMGERDTDSDAAGVQPYFGEEGSGDTINPPSTK